MSRNLLVALLLFLTTHNAASTVLETTGSFLTGATEVNVGGVMYDVSFINDSATNIFGAIPVFDAVTKIEADNFSLALIEQVLIGSYSIPSNIFGCEGSYDCHINTPYGVDKDAGSGIDLILASQVDMGGYSLDSNDVQDAAWERINWVPGGQTVYADWRVATVPEPTTFTLLGLGLLGLGFTRRK